jgi:hypothetical protein
MSATQIYKIDRPLPLRARVAQAIPNLKWTHNGLGLLQAVLSEPELRIHIWHPSLITSQAQFGKIHDHRFDLVSSVLLGTIYHTERLLIPNDKGKWVLKIIDGSINTLPSIRYNIQDTTFAITEGNYYTYPKGLFHSAETTSLAITLCEKHNFEPEKPVIGAIRVSKLRMAPTIIAPWDHLLIEAQNELMKKCT